MCGIAGVFNHAGVSGSQLEAMARTIRHRGPDDEGYILIDHHGNPQYLRGDDTISEINVKHINSEPYEKRSIGGMAHRRLTIIDLSPAGHQPLSVDNDNYSIVYNGEVYNFKEIREELCTLGFNFISQSDSEVILNAYREWGDHCVNKFIGMWAFAIWDKKKRRVFLSRDRFGIKPLYYFKKEGLFAFASEIKSLLLIDSIKKCINNSNLFQYIMWGRNADSEATLFENIREFPAGFNASYSPNVDMLEKKAYYDLKSSVDQLRDQPDRSDPIDKYRFLFERSVDLHLRSDVPVGSCLSGGLDSSSIVAVAANRMRGMGINTFTAAYTDPQIDESSFARSVSDKYRNIIPHTAYPSALNFWNDFGQMIWHQDLPFASSSIYAQWVVMKLASENGMKVLLDGQGADESLGGYAYFGGFYLLDLIKKHQYRVFLSEAHQIKKHRSIRVSNELKRAIFHQIPNGLKNKLHATKRIAPQFLNVDFVNKHSHLQYPEEYGTSFIERSYDSFRFGLRELLRYEDRNSMAFSIESRVPFLDHRLVEFSLSLENHWKIKRGWTKFVLRKSMENNLPNEIAWRKDKKGFVTPQQAWKEQLKLNLFSYLKEFDVSNIFNIDYLIKYTNTPSIDINSISTYWKIVSIVKWLEVQSIKSI